jgi:sialate O-acetylesterase
MKRMQRLCLATLLVVGWTTQAPADVTMPATFGSHMVLQQGTKTPLWGTAGRGEKVTVSFAGQMVATEAAADGKWMVALPPMEASASPRTLTVSGKNTLQFEDVLVGEVWVCSGQSNMEMGIKECNNGKEEIAAADYPQLRLFTVRRWGAKGHPWAPCNPHTVAAADAGGFSAAAYYFGRSLYKELKIPIGLINSSFGGTAAELWTSRKALDSRPELRALKGSQLYDGMIAPLMPYAIRGVIWYQGESNVGRAEQYGTLLPTMIRDWRGHWGQGDFPFYFVQIAPYRYNSLDAVAELWEAQLRTMKSVPNTGMVVTTDIGELANIHPRNKQEVGRRLALWALAKDYGEDVVYSGPIYKSMAPEGDKVRLTFDYVDGGLKSADGEPLSFFTVAGADQKFVPAEAAIDGQTIVVSSKAVAQPASVRFAWREDATPNLVNAAGLPASPFRTDSWKGVNVPKKSGQ